MNVNDLCTRDVVTVRATDDLSFAARLMRDEHVGYLVVVEPAFQERTFKPVGVSRRGMRAPVSSPPLGLA